MEKGATMRKALLRVSIVLLVGLGAYFYYQKPSTGVYPLAKVVINLTPDAASSLIWAAEGAGYFREQNLQPEFKVFGAGKLALEDLVANPNTDYTFVYETPIAKQIINGKELRLLTGLHTSNRNTRLVMKGSKPASEPDGLIGKRIGVQMGTNAEFALIELLNRNGIQMSEVKAINMLGTQIPKRVTTNEVDGVMIWNPFFGEAVRNLKAEGNAYWEPELGYYHEYSFLVTDQARAQKNAQLSVRVLAAINKAYELYKSEPDKFAEYAGAFTPVSMGKEKVKAELTNVDLIFGLNSKMAQALQMEVKYFCITQGDCNTDALQRRDSAIDTTALDRVAPHLNQYRSVR